MTEPTFQNKGTKYLIEWPEHELIAQVSRIHANHERTSCQLLFTTTNPDSHPHLLETRFTLSSSRSRSEVAKQIKPRYKTGIDWENILEYISVKSLREFEKGEPITEIISTDDVKPLEYLIKPIAPKYKPTVLFGPPGSGKSQLVTIFAIIMALPWTDNPLRLEAPQEPCEPLILDYEADIEDISRNLRYIQNGMDLGATPVYYRRCTVPLADDIEAILALIEEKNIRCLIIDSISLAAGGDLNHMDVATSYFRALRQLKVTTISIAHTSKDTEGRNKSILGSVLFEAGARSVWEVKAHVDDDEEYLDIALFQTKANLSKRAKPLGFRLTYGDEKTYVEWHDPKNIEEFVERMSVKQRILSALKQGRLSSEELTTRLEVKRNTIDQETRRLRSKDLITGDSTGWGLLFQGNIPNL